MTATTKLTLKILVPVLVIAFAVFTAFPAAAFVLNYKNIQKQPQPMQQKGGLEQIETPESVAQRIIDNPKTSEQLAYMLESRMDKGADLGGLENMLAFERGVNDQVGELEPREQSMIPRQNLEFGGQSFSEDESWMGYSFPGFGSDYRINNVEVYENSSNFVLATGGNGDASRAVVSIYNGNEWNATELPIVPELALNNSVRASLIIDRDDIYVGGRQSQIYHYDGQSWNVENYYVEGEETMTNIYKFIKDGNDLYAMAQGDYVWKQNGSSWEMLDVQGRRDDYCTYWDAQILGNDMYVLCDDIDHAKAKKIDLETLELTTVVEQLDETTRFVNGMYVESPEVIYFASSGCAAAHCEDDEFDKLVMFKYDHGDIIRIEGLLPEQDMGKLVTLVDMELDSAGNIWVVGEYGAVGTMNDSDVLEVAQADLNADGTRDRDDWFNIHTVSPKQNFAYMSSVMADDPPVFRLGEPVQPQISFQGLETQYSGGDQMNISLKVDNQAGENEELDVYVVLEAYGSYYFWPTWTEVDSKKITVSKGEVKNESVISLTLPEDLGTSGPYKFHALVTAPDTFVPFSNYVMNEFSFVQ